MNEELKELTTKELEQLDNNAGIIEEEIEETEIKEEKGDE